MNYAASTLAMLLILQGCATVPPVCPRLPAPPVLAPPGQSFQDEMRAILSASQPAQTSFELTSKPAAVGSKR